MWAGKKVWLVGASEGIGAATAMLLAGEGAQLVLSARSTEKLVSLVASLPGAGHMVQNVDVTNNESVVAAWEAIEARWGGVDMVMYNAGIYTPMSAKDFDLQKTEAMMDVNFGGALRVLAPVIPYFMAKKAGHIVLVASVAAYRGLPRAIGYGASKAALLHLGENMAIDLDGTGIKVQVVCPGFVKTRLTDINEFPMPFIMTADKAAQRIVRGISSNRFEVYFPKRFALILKTMQLLPHKLYFALVNKV